MYGKYYLLGAMAVILIIFSISRDGFSPKNISQYGTYGLLNVFLAYLAGIVITPALLPYIPARSFSLKGFYSGLLMFLLLLVLGRTGNNIFEIGSWFLIIAAISSFTAMNFTGSSTYTSLSGVKKEMKISLPLQIGTALIGVILLVIGKLY
jgi:acetyl-CoA decarbonylase/synthase complex subunit gamma